MCQLYVVTEVYYTTLFLRRQINEEVRAMMRELFPSLEPELVSFIDFGDRLDNL